ncbi:hypothetical protein EJ08DRAFT_700815 [Tothia fuscella]|uniref:Uncharacterized protein n=1 Tax=Tothia fuscella TaxID=1048955 RepID=A0A9P4NJP0_9PEZI|nr:hypothetical protein EJ08DRAFT_700815 [Tothia fuscella]
MSMGYSKDWQYTVEQINWEAGVYLPERSQASVVLSWAFDSNFPKLGGTSIMSWTLSGLRRDIWQDIQRVPAENQLWSRCGQTSPLAFEWQVKIESFPARQRILQGGIGDSTNGLGLELVMRWRQCGSSGGSDPVQSATEGFGSLGGEA